MPGPWSRKRKRIVALLGVLVVGALVYISLKRKDDTTAKWKEEMAAVQRGPVAELLRETGRIEFVRTVELKSTLSGEILRLFAQPGETIERDQPLALIRPDPNQVLQLHNARAAVDRVRIDVSRVRKDLERKDALLERKLVSEEEVDRLRDDLQKAQNAFRLSLLELETLETRANIERTTSKDGKSLAGSDKVPDDIRILSPTSGIVIARAVEIGEVVVSGISSTVTGTKLYEIGDPSEMIVRADISEVDVGRLLRGQHVDIVVDAFPDTTYAGLVHHISPVGQIKQGSSVVVFDTEILILEPDVRLRQGMSCDIDIRFARKDSTLFLPVEAVYEDFGEEVRPGDKKGRQGNFMAFVRQGDTTFVARNVTIGLRSETKVEILDGLALGDSTAAEGKKVFDRLEAERKKKEKEKKPEEKTDTTSSASSDTR